MYRNLKQLMPAEEIFVICADRNKLKLEERLKNLKIVAVLVLASKYPAMPKKILEISSNSLFKLYGQLKQISHSLLILLVS
jgi:hypothetical protein